MKRLKREITIYSLPDQVIEFIRDITGRDSFKTLLLVNKSYQQELERFVYCNIKALWYDLQQQLFVSFLVRRKRFITSIRIIDTYSFGEWQINVFDDVFTQLPYLQQLSVNTFNSSNWLKYRSNQLLKSLDLYYDIEHHETQNLSQNPNPKNINRLTKSSNLPKIFELDHLRGFKNLTTLTLNNYHFNWDEKCLGPNLKQLKLVNCTWEYPFTPAKFNESNSLIRFELHYTEQVAFLYLERFSKFLDEPFKFATNINKLIVGLEGNAVAKNLPSNRLRMFLDNSIFPHLKHLDLSGWITDEKSLYKILVSIPEISLSYLKLHVEHPIQLSQWPQLKIASLKN